MEEQITPSAWPLHRVGLRALNLATLRDYYTKFGFTVVKDEEAQGTLGLGAGAAELLGLRLLSGGRPRPWHTAGLFHFAILVPDEVALGSFLRHCINVGIALEGASDHLVSHSLYLRDPEHNGIEVYADLPRDQWPRQGGSIRMDTLPLNLNRLLAMAQPFTTFPAGTRLGHIHLNVGDLNTSRAFYEGLGMELMVSLGGQANFLSWDGYHHHLGANIWEGRNIPRQEPDMYGLDFFEIARPGLEPATLEDPDGMQVHSIKPGAV